MQSLSRLVKGLLGDKSNKNIASSSRSASQAHAGGRSGLPTEGSNCLSAVFFRATNAGGQYDDDDSQPDTGYVKTDVASSGRVGQEPRLMASLQSKRRALPAATEKQLQHGSSANTPANFGGRLQRKASPRSAGPRAPTKATLGVQGASCSISVDSSANLEERASCPHDHQTHAAVSAVPERHTFPKTKVAHQQLQQQDRGPDWSDAGGRCPTENLRQSAVGGLTADSDAAAHMRRHGIAGLPPPEEEEEVVGVEQQELSDESVAAPQPPVSPARLQQQRLPHLHHLQQQQQGQQQQPNSPRLTAAGSPQLGVLELRTHSQATPAPAPAPASASTSAAQGREDLSRPDDQGSPGQVGDGLLFLAADVPLGMLAPGGDGWSTRSFRITHQLHKGYASSVFKATCRRSGSDVVLKAYNLAGLSDFLLYQMLRELDIHSRLQHEYIVKLLAAFKEGDMVVMVQEYASGGSACRVRRKLGGRMTEFQAMHLVLLPLLGVLTYLHERGIVHRDIKPENLLFTESWQLKLCDYGVSICLREERAVTRTGSREYMAPEVSTCPLKHLPEDNKNNPELSYSTAVDIWSLGALMYELLVGFTPFPGGPPARKEGARGSAGAALAFPSSVSQGARTLVRDCLQLDPADRPTVHQLMEHVWVREALEDAAGGVEGALLAAGEKRFRARSELPASR